MSNINFVTVDSQSIQNQLITDFEAALGETLYPADERRLFLLQMIPVIVGLKNDINETGRSNLLRYATGDKLDEMGEFYSTQRLPATKAKATVKVTLSAAQGANVIVPEGTRVTPDGQLYFAVSSSLIIPTGTIQGEAVIEATEGGKEHNGFAPGQIKTIVDPIPYVANIINTSTSSGGADVEDDNSYRERIRLAPESYSVAGPEGAYVYWAKTASVNIDDVSVTSPSPGVVKIAILMQNGEIPSPEVISAVEAAVNSKDRRPLTDNVQVLAPEEVAYNINLTYYISRERQTEETVIRDAIEGSNGAIVQYHKWQSGKLGREINPDYLRQLMLNGGAYRIDITSPAWTEVQAGEVATQGIATINYGGLV
ncbi:phage-related baseplate assembly protein [Anaerobacterium chartisolvens]|uniref:Phage-related baseplate assembly protein n=1 Tax=Anaerobacterium chartisolvens TaxID=1297424 RepID=A0A369BH40_9FIRM|nr:baseplate J/gp47 family protein [Anaerobacterium chartisolvens]RCX20872.1 phage-related baseplate assembly protein [Anaerobacterium chartisolvens]